jgi:hypothetical protein
MQGSYSMKTVLPTVDTNLTYADLDEVADGRAAQRAYSEAIDPRTSDERREEIQQKLARYCGLDSGGMLTIVRHLTRR